MISSRNSKRIATRSIGVWAVVIFLIVTSTPVSIARPAHLSYRPKTSTRSKRNSYSQRRVQLVKPEKCKFKKFKSPKSGKGSKSDDDAAGRRRRIASIGSAPRTLQNSKFVMQEATTVYYDAQVPLIQPLSSPSKGKGSSPSKGKSSKANYYWHYGEDGDKPDSDYDYVECDYPSVQPSVSPSPSQIPSDTPTNVPSISPSMAPSYKPSVSQAPSVSMAPSKSAIPSQTPSRAFSAGCDPDLVDTNDLDEITGDGSLYEYQMVFSESANESEMVAKFDKFLDAQLRDMLFWCGDKNVDTRKKSRRRSLVENEIENIVIDDISMNGKDIEQTNKKCSTSTLVASNQKCKVFQGDYTLYVKDDRGVTNTHLWSNVNSMIRVIMSNVQEDDIPDVVKVIFGGVEDADGPITLAAGQRGDGQPITERVSPLGGTIMGLGVLITLLFLFAATRKREHYRMERVEQIYDDDDSLFGKSIGQATDVMSSGSRARVVGDDDSLFMDSDDIVADIQMAEKHRLYGMGVRGTRLGPRENDLGGSGEAINVHKCTSATCQICASRNRPIFVNSELSFEENELFTPTYSDTVDMDMANRHYMSPDTVEM
mmetsp:Transcript_10835/g.20269  ORF Transcript_10835/g.20269 Transcript_10835/m.20269 type:complete len:597 (+) Transcript_10835:504-2294(+)|eukprot:CAMPEP_0176476712 /NCGR_PEP_ID=MMETSP0200_2-20121128/209_1 /TAXON_ID=947934 /ORGANISM="Chaetoceros sp., Strain GSL56" /LENGTH=596 /DNA_ID=CAMNT_0017872421 /DNA_START=486 /DNA_END=2279 /DNA_ORIENTATION=-